MAQQRKAAAKTATITGPKTASAPADAPVTRFAPSPTGFLHIGGARTALFNWLYARRHGGRFVLRIEDTDRARSTPEATEAIFEGMRWLGLDWDGEAVSQFSRAERHREAVAEMLQTGAAYRCYAAPEALQSRRDAAESLRVIAKAPAAHALSAEAAKPLRAAADLLLAAVRSPYRDGLAPPSEDAPFVVRLRAPDDGETVVPDVVQGDVTLNNRTLDDLILLRSDGTPTYNLAVVVDDHDMAVSHVIRGDDHLTNAARQSLIYRALGWTPPTFAHIPLIHGPDGAKLSKRHGALGVDAYRDMGYLPEAMRNYLARLGWSHGDDEFFTTEQATEWFNLDAIGKAPARFDFAKLENLNAQHMRAMAPEALIADFETFLATREKAAPAEKSDRLRRAAGAIAERAKTLIQFEEMAYYVLTERPLDFDDKAAGQIDDAARATLGRLTEVLADASAWEKESLDAALRAFAVSEGVKLGKIAQPLRAALTGRGASPGVFDVMDALGRDETLARLSDVIAKP